MMLRLCLLGLLAVCFVNGDYFDNKVADTDYLLKQKKIYNLLYHATQPSVVNLPLYKEGQAYNIDANIDSYSNPAAVKDFLYMYEQGMLPRGEVFSFFYPKLFKECQALFKLFYYAKDFETFYKTALWARIYTNENQFIISLYNAVIRRPDTLYIQLPPPYELFPNLFFNAEVLEKAHHVKSFGKMDTEKSEGYETYVIPANYSGWYLNREYDLENKLNYFTEDIGLNAYYFFFRLDSPLWMTKEEFNLPSYRGGEYLYGHKQLLNRYYLERLSNDLPKIEDFDWQKPFFAGYYPTMTFANGLPFPQRQQWSNFPYFKNNYVKDIHDMEMRVSAAIDSGFALDATGKWVNIYTPEGLNLLGNMIEGNGDSCNREFYGSIDIFGRKILGFNLEPANSYHILPSALEFFSTSLRDPAFYRFYKRIINYYYKYQAHQKQYNKNEIVYPSLKIESFVIDKLITYFDQFDATISNGLMVEDQKQADSQLVKVRQYRLNHKPFSFHFTINSEKQTKATIRVFLGPKYDAHHRLIECPENFKYFYEIDNYMVNLNAGLNKISRKSEDFFFVINDQEPSEIYYEKVLKALDGSKPLSYYQRLTGFPERLILPKGKKEGMPFQLFAYVSPVNAEIEYSSRIFGSYKMDTKPFGFPLDRLVYNYKYDGPNMISKDIFIFHKDEMDLNIAY